MPTSLLDLPREIRDHILYFALFAAGPNPGSAPNPASPTTKTTSQQSPQRIEFHDLNYTSAYGGQRVLYNPYNPQLSGHSLLLTNHQLHSETRAALSRHPPVYTIDVDIEDEIRLCPTWTCVPTITDRLDTVYARFHLVGTEMAFRLDDREAAFYGLYDIDGSGFRAGDGGPGLIVWAFYSLLERFLKRGPAVPRHGQGPKNTRRLWNWYRDLIKDERDHDRRVSIRMLDLDIRSPPRPLGPEPPPLRRGPYDDAICRMHDFLGLRRDYCTLYALPPALVADYLSAHISGLLSMSYHKAEYSALLYERIGCIRVRLDGEVRKEWDLALCLAGRSVENSTDGWRLDYSWGWSVSFEKWKGRAMKRRRAAGLAIVGDNNQDQEIDFDELPVWYLEALAT